MTRFYGDGFDQARIERAQAKRQRKALLRHGGLKRCPRCPTHTLATTDRVKIEESIAKGAACHMRRGEYCRGMILDAARLKVPLPSRAEMLRRTQETQARIETP
jgi:hypothetical protein